MMAAVFYVEKKCTHEYLYTLVNTFLKNWSKNRIFNPILMPNSSNAKLKNFFINPDK